ALPLRELQDDALLRRLPRGDRVRLPAAHHGSAVGQVHGESPAPPGPPARSPLAQRLNDELAFSRSCHSHKGGSMRPVSRRTFLKGTAVAAGGLALPLLASAEAQAATPPCLWGAFPDPNVAPYNGDIVK